MRVVPCLPVQSNPLYTVREYTLFFLPTHTKTVSFRRFFIVMRNRDAKKRPPFPAVSPHIRFLLGHGRLSARNLAEADGLRVAAGLPGDLPAAYRPDTTVSSAFRTCAFSLQTTPPLVMWLAASTRTP